MLKILAQLEHKIGDRTFYLLCDSQAPHSEVKQALVEFMSNVVALEKSAIDEQRVRMEQAEKVIEESNV